MLEQKQKWSEAKSRGMILNKEIGNKESSQHVVSLFLRAKTKMIRNQMKMKDWKQKFGNKEITQHVVSLILRAKTKIMRNKM